jgi:aminodeoxychorismate lyase
MTGSTHSGHSRRVKIWVHGHLVDEASATISVLDRSFQYGDAVFESIRVYGGLPFLWEEHLSRLHEGARLLKISLPFDNFQLRNAATELLTANHHTEAMLRLHLTRGVGIRGYSPRGANSPRVIIGSTEIAPVNPMMPVSWTLHTASQRLPARDPLTACKTANKLIQVLARMEAEEAGANDALLLNTAGEVAETSCANLFWMADGRIFTPPVSSGALAGITRRAVMEVCRRLGIPAGEVITRLPDLHRADGIFLSVSSLEIVPITALDGVAIPVSPQIQRVHLEFRRMVQERLGSPPATP